MPELIYRQAALSEIDATIEGSLQRPEDVYIDKGLMMARTIIKNLPLIEAEPVRRGRWIEVTKHRDENGTIQTDYECSECFAMVKDICAEEIESERFCYNCGADMREGGADNG